MERSRVDEITRLNSYSAQSAAMFEYDGAMVQDLSMQLFRAMARIDVLEAAVMAQPRSDGFSAGLDASSDTLVYAERPENFGDCDGSRAGEVERVSDAMVQPLPTMVGVQDDVQAGGDGEDEEMTDGPAVSGDGGVEVFDVGRSADVVQEGDDDVGDQTVSMEDEQPSVVSADGGDDDGFGEVLRGGSGADMGRPSASMVDDRVGGELVGGAGLMEDAANTARWARRAADGDGGAGRAGGAGGSGDDSATVAESGADVGRLGFGKIVAGMLSAESSRVVEDEAVIGKDNFGDAGGADDGSAVVATGSRADVDRSQADVVRAEGSVGGLEDVSHFASGDEWRWWYHRNRWFRFRQADGTTSGFQWPGLQIDVGELAIWAMGADSRAITKQEAALMVLRTMVMRARANGEGQR